MKIMKARFAVVFLALMCICSGCDWSQDPIVTPIGKEDAKEPDITVATTMSTTINGINLLYKVADSQLKTGETLLIEADSENDVKPLVAVYIDEVEVKTPEIVPFTYKQVMSDKGEYKITFKVYKDKDNFTFETSTSITVE